MRKKEQHWELFFSILFLYKFRKSEKGKSKRSVNRKNIFFWVIQLFGDKENIFVSPFFILRADKDVLEAKLKHFVSFNYSSFLLVVTITRACSNILALEFPHDFWRSFNGISSCAWHFVQLWVDWKWGKAAEIISSCRKFMMEEDEEPVRSLITS